VLETFVIFLVGPILFSWQASIGSSSWGQSLTSLPVEVTTKTQSAELNTRLPCKYINMYMYVVGLQWHHAWRYSMHHVTCLFWDGVWLWDEPVAQPVNVSSSVCSARRQRIPSRPACSGLEVTPCNTSHLRRSVALKRACCSTFQAFCTLLNVRRSCSIVLLLERINKILIWLHTNRSFELSE
jgi:hypothetical protein